ncbi:MAG TPA: MBL fold metallo-hydrolase [Pyrinomonadaceae bacterium]|jgi:Zn-dependent hydrolases, including glyoxylases|nr:MBL fold metallo-hydrolase [Pyrinomonadaceae bacterium]
MQVGDYRVEIIPDTEFHLDGGAMFGVIPRNLWSKVCPPDDENRIRMNMNCVFVDTGKEKILIETGIGEKWSPKQTSMYGITREQPLAKTLEQKTGSGPEDINIVINTHLHFDHAGGNTDAKSPDVVLPAFPNARYLVSSAELKHAEEPSERDRASYLPDNWRPLRKTGQLEETEANYEVVPGLTMETHPGHNRSMQCWRLDRGGQIVFGFADLIPMRAHVSLPWIMGYDLYPVETLESKKRLLPQAVHEGWIGLLYHDPDAALFRFVEDEGKIVPRPFEE